MTEKMLHIRHSDGREGAVLPEAFADPDKAEHLKGADILGWEDGTEHHGPATADGMVRRAVAAKEERREARRERREERSGPRGRSGEHRQDAEHGHHGGGHGRRDQDAEAAALAGTAQGVGPDDAVPPTVEQEPEQAREARE